MLEVSGSARPATRARSGGSAPGTRGAWAHGGLALLGLLLVAPPAVALETVEEIRACQRSNQPRETSVQKLELESRDRSGATRRLEARLHWKRFPDEGPRVMIRVDRPSDLRGAGFVVIDRESEDEMFMYLPAVQKVRRITSRSLSDQLWGTDFSYEDVKRLQGISDSADATRLPDASVAGLRVWVLSTGMTPTDESPYERIVSYVDPETCLPLRVEFFEHGDAPRKVLTLQREAFERIDARWVAREFEMADVREKTSTRLWVRDVQLDVDVPDRVFNPSLLSRGR